MMSYDNSKSILHVKQHINKYNAISLVRLLFSNYYNKKRPKICNDSDNPFIHLLYWLDNENKSLGDYNILETLFPYLSDRSKLYVIKRYFHDIRNGYTAFVPQLLENLKNNRYDYISIYRECLFPRNIHDISVPLLLDSLLNVYKKNPIQTFNGILDIAIKNSNPYSISDTVKWQSIFPHCKEAGLVNSKFKGFIDLFYEGKLDENKLNDSKKLQEFVDRLVSHYNSSSKKDTFVRKLLFNQNGQDLNNEITQLEISQISLTRLSKNIREIFYSKAEKVSDTSYIANVRDIRYLDEFVKIEKKLIKPSIHEGISLSITKYDSIDRRYYKNSIDILSLEDIRRHVSDLLENELKKYKDFFIVENDNQLNSILNTYYYYLEKIENEKYADNFLYSLSESSDLCCPSLSDTYDVATGLPYYNCRGRMCFHNLLQNQTIENETDWHKYTFFHLVEIMGYPIIQKEEAGYECGEEIKRFIGLVRKAIKKFDVLKCKSCGHLIFPVNRNSNNNYMYFACQNPDCSEYNKEYYINTCYNCGELIDSRESTKCPNGRYICQFCLSCCSNEQFENEIQRATRIYKRISSYYLNLQGKGHNDNNLFYCPCCGYQLNKIEENIFLCSKCQKKYSRITRTWN